MKKRSVWYAALGLVSLAAEAQPSRPEASLESLLRGKSTVVDKVLSEPDKYEVQILYTQIDRDRYNRPRFCSYQYRVDRKVYFYPASTVKMPAAFLALEKLNQLKRLGLNKYTPMRTDSACCEQTSIRYDSTASNWMPSVAHYIRKIFLVSDNDAYNRLYEFLGQGWLNETLHRKEYPDVRIVSRLSVGASREQNRFTNPIRFGETGKEIYQQPLTENTHEYKSPWPVRKGKGELKGDSLVWEPKDFTYANTFPLEDQQAMLQAVLFPEAVPKKWRFQLTADDYRFLYQYMSQLPRETPYPRYQGPEYVDGYVKFFLYGDRKDSIPPNIRIFNKVGEAYGYLTDNAYVVDFDRGIEFMLSATIYVNEDQVFNDDKYEYESVGFPFLAELGRILYTYETQRPRKSRPDLSRFRVPYDRPSLKASE